MMTPEPKRADISGRLLEGPTVVMDARCALCARGAAWIARHDTQEAFVIVPIQSDVGAALMRRHGLDPADPSSWLYLESGRGYTSLDAVIRSGRRLGGRWRMLAALGVIPRTARDALYHWVARNRYRWFGSVDVCSMPDPEVQRRLWKAP